MQRPESPTDPYKNLPPQLRARLMDQKLPRNWRTLGIALAVTVVLHVVVVGYIFLTGPGPRPVLVYLNLIDPVKAGKLPPRHPRPTAPQQRLF